MQNAQDTILARFFSSGLDRDTLIQVPPSSKFRVPSSKFRQVPPSSKFRQVPSSEFRVPSSKFRVPSSAKFRQVPPSSAKFQVPPSSAKFRQVPHISSSKFPSSQFIINILDFIQFYSTSSEFYRIHSL